MFRFESPLAFLALLLPLLLWGWRRIWRYQRPSLPVSGVVSVADLPRSWRVRLAWLPAALSLLAWSCLTVALARPQFSQEQVEDITEGIAMEMVIDRSGSMRAPMEYQGKLMNRLEAVKLIFSDFVFGDGNALEGRRNDLIGVVAFAHYPYTFCPLTLDHAALKFALGNIQLITEAGDENGTACGDAVAMGIARLQAAENTLSAQAQQKDGAYRIKSKVIILLTDGQDEGPHTRSIQESAELAKKYGIKVYSIALVGQPRRNIFGFTEPEYDTGPVRQLAEATGGIFRTCDSAEALRDFYREIDRLEKSEMTSLRHVSYRELYFPFAASALVALLLAILFNAFIFRRIP